MPAKRPPKRARKKEHRAARREAIQSFVRRRRRQRRLVLALTILVLIGGGTALALIAFREETPQASPSPTPDKADSIVAPIREPVACDADLPEAAGSTKKQYKEPEDQELDPDKTYTLRLETSCGTIDIELAVEEAPTVANSVAFLAREGFYDGLVFHRNLPGFVIQGGDPTGDGSGGAGYEVIKVPGIETKYTKGVVAMANSGQQGAAGSQFFIVVGEDASLPPSYAILGKVVAGQDVAEEIVECCESSDSPPKPPSVWAYIERATVIEE